MKLLATYRNNAIKFERLTAEETNPARWAHFKAQAEVYRKLAEERAEKFGSLAPAWLEDSESVS
jgi:hypothetical protein